MAACCLVAENGSGGFMSEVYFFNGAIGIQCKDCGTLGIPEMLY